MLLHNRDLTLFTPLCHIVRTHYTTPVINMHLKKSLICEIVQTLPPDRMDNDHYYLFTLPTCLKHHGQIGDLNTNITDYDTEHYAPDIMVYWRDKRRSDQLRVKLDKHRRDLLEAAGNPHMFVQGPSKDEEVEIRARSWVPSQNVKEESIMPKLEYPSLPVSPDPNNY